MSYINMDHAGWLEAEIAAHKRTKPDAKQRRALAEHKGWHAAPDTLNDFQRRAVNILGIVGDGIYNAPIAWTSVMWAPDFIGVSWRNELATFDFMALTRFVFLCHDARIRGAVQWHSFGHLYLILHKRSHKGQISLRHPNLEEAVATWREELPITHSIYYRESESADDASS